VLLHVFPARLMFFQMMKATDLLEIQERARAVAKDDELKFIRLRTMMFEVPNLYAVLQDFLVKNMEKIEDPRGDNR
jgi:hypothetical protein